MAWQTPKTNWASADVPAPADFNRIEGDIQHIEENIQYIEENIQYIEENIQYIEENIQDIEGDIQHLYDNKITNGGNTPSILADILANRPAPGITGRIFIATDADIIFRDTGSTWKIIDIKFVQPGDTILLEALTERTVTTSAAIVKQFRVMRPGRYRITGELRSSFQSTNTDIAIYAEAPMISPEILSLGTYNTTSTSYVSFSIDFANWVPPGALIKINLSNFEATAYIRNVRVRYNIPSEPADLVIQN